MHTGPVLSPALRGHVHGIEGPLIIGTDASLAAGYGVWAYVGTNGHWAVNRDRDVQYSSNLIELKAIALALASSSWNIDDHDRITVLTDSLSALGWIERWRTGDTELPEAYDPGPMLSDLRVLQRRAARCAHIEFRHVRAHEGHPLNECADSIARLVRRNTTHKGSLANMKEQIKPWVSGRLEQMKTFEADGAPPS